MTDKTENRYHKDEVVTPKDGITYLRFDMEPVNGVVYCEYENGQLWIEVNYSPTSELDKIMFGE
jgi:antitoxin component YwqK of YwqJK toxin-antitoxin module